MPKGAPRKPGSTRRSRAVVHEGDCLEVLKGFKDASVDSIVTDPPAGIGFMGKEWDTPGSLVERRARRGETWDMVGGNHHPKDSTDKFRTLRSEGAKFRAFLTPVFEECLRVLKPGGHALIWALPRTSHWTGTAIEDAGFEVRDVIAHHFGTGFPKSLNVAAAIDKRRVEDEAPTRAICRAIRAAMDAKGLKSRDLVTHFHGCHPRMIDHWAARDTDSQPQLPTWEQWMTLKRVLALDSALDVEVHRLNERKGSPGTAWREAEVVGIQHGMMSGWNADGSTAYVDRERKAPATPEAKQWSGWGTSLKPATEFWFLARKPLDATVAQNVLQHGTGALNIDGCRISTNENLNGGAYAKAPGQRDDGWRFQRGGAGEYVPPTGRWPANLILSHAPTCTDAACVPSCAVAEMDRQSGERAPGHFPKNTGQSPMWGGEGGGLNGRNQTERYTEAGGASRFFYVPKPSRAERDLGLDELPMRTADAYAEHRGRRMDEPSRFDGKPTGKGRNTHPTVKPIALMRYLARLVTPPAGVILDPFTGSGTTGCAAVLEGFQFVGIEREPEYVKLARRRIRAAAQ